MTKLTRDFLLTGFFLLFSTFGFAQAYIDPIVINGTNLPPSGSPYDPNMGPEHSPVMIPDAERVSVELQKRAMRAFLRIQCKSPGTGELDWLGIAKAYCLKEFKGVTAMMQACRMVATELAGAAATDSIGIPDCPLG
jgi:hypothetical protein